MGGEQGRKGSGNSESNLHCSLCNRTFAQGREPVGHPFKLTWYTNTYPLESTRKRHYYYCRSKQSDTNTSRKRSCVPCVRAKTRCTWPADTSLDACVRCNRRGVTCEYDAVVRRHGALSQGDSCPTSVVVTPDERQSLPIQEDPTTSTLPQGLTHASNLQASIATQAHRDTSIAAPFSLQLDGNWDTGLREVNMPGFRSPELLGSQDIDCMKAWGMIIPGASPLALWPRHLPSPSLFNPRAFTKPEQVPLVSLAMRILRSYPYMIVPKGMLPPFLSPRPYSCAEAARGPSQKVGCSASLHWQREKYRIQYHRSLEDHGSLLGVCPC